MNALRRFFLVSTYPEAALATTPTTPTSACATPSTQKEKVGTTHGGSDDHESTSSKSSSPVGQAVKFEEDMAKAEKLKT